MEIKAVLFDLDGTLLPMDQDLFIKKYLMRISSYLSKYGYDASKLAKNIMKGTYAMIKNDGALANEKVFWRAFEEIYGEGVIDDMKYFDKFYVEQFDGLSEYCGFNAEAKQTVEYAKGMGLRTVLATNPVFPEIATHKRMSWAGFVPEDFELCTTYENSHYCKPYPAYYGEILEKLGLSPEECLMVGNDVRDDMTAGMLGMKVFLLTDCLINSENKDIEKYPRGDFSALKKYLEEFCV